MQTSEQCSVVRTWFTVCIITIQSIGQIQDLTEDYSPKKKEGQTGQSDELNLRHNSDKRIQQMLYGYLDAEIDIFDLSFLNFVKV